MQKKLAQDQVESLMKAREDKEVKQKVMFEKREFKNILKKEVAMLKLEEKLQNVQRIAKANEYAAEKVKQRIEFDKQRGEALAAEKADMLKTRFAVRRQADQDKRAMLEKVETLKKQGKLKHSDLTALFDEEPAETGPGFDSINVQDPAGF